MLKPFGLSIFFYRTKTILSTKNIRKYTHEYTTSISQNTHICSAKYSHSTTKYIATNLQQHNIQKTKTILLQCKNPLFARQKGGFYTPKTPFLFFVSITNTLLMCYEYSVKHPRTTPPGVGADSSRPYPYIIKNVYFHNQICVSALLNMRLHSTFCGYIHIRGHDKSAPTAADGLPIMLRTFHNNATHTLLFWGKYKKGTP